MSENSKTQQIDPRRIRKFLDSEQGVRVAFVNATEAVQEMQQIQGSKPLATMMVGRAMVGAALLASQMKDGEVISVYFHGDGPIRTVFAESQFEGGVRGFTPHPELDLPLTEAGLDLKGAIGEGHLTVVRTHPNRTTPTKGTVPIQTAQIGDDIAYYLQQSQQIRSAIALGVKLNERGEVLAAGGILIELLPGANVNIEIMVEDQFVRASSISESIASDKSVEDILEDYLPVLNLKEIEHPYSVSYTCKCSKNRLLAAMELFKDEDLQDIVDKKENPIAKCEFCGRQYTLEWSEVKDVLNRRLNTKLH